MPCNLTDCKKNTDQAFNSLTDAEMAAMWYNTQQEVVTANQDDSPREHMERIWRMIWGYII